MKSKYRLGRRHRPPLLCGEGDSHRGGYGQQSGTETRSEEKNASRSRNIKNGPVTASFSFHLFYKQLAVNMFIKSC